MHADTSMNPPDEGWRNRCAHDLSCASHRRRTPGTLATDQEREGGGREAHAGPHRAPRGGHRAPPGPMRTWPPPGTVMALRCAPSVHAGLPQDSRPRWSAQRRPSPRARASWMAPKQRGCWPCGAVRPPQATPRGPSRDVPPNASRSTWGRRSRRQRADRREKNPAHVARTHVWGESPGAPCRRWGPHSREAGALAAPRGSPAPAGQEGGAAGAAESRNAPARARPAGHALAGRCRRGTGRDGPRVSGPRAPEGGRTIDRSAHRTAVAGAPQLTPRRADGDPDADTVLGGGDTLHTPKRAARSETWAPPEARKLAQRLERHSTPTHGSWLHRAVIALRGLTTPWLDRRIAAIAM